MNAQTKLLSDPPPRQILPPERIDDVGQAVLALARELWVVKDRMAIMEQVLAENGLSISEKIDAYQPDDALQAKLNATQQNLLETVLRALNVEIETTADFVGFKTDG